MTSIPQEIKVLALDVDGVLTDGTITFSENLQHEIKTFHVHDGLGISLWQKAGNHVIFISGRNAECVSIRAKELGVKYIYQGSKDKLADLHTALSKIGATMEQTCFVGDDLGDLPSMQFAGHAIAVGDAAPEIQDIADFTTAKLGGRGAVREAIEYLMRASGTWEATVEKSKAEPATQ